MIFRKVNVLLVALSLCCTLPCYSQAAEAAVEKADVATPAEEEKEAKPAPLKILGWKEWVWVVKPELILRAKLDTGARTCSIHASNIEAFELDGKKWVKFTISDPNNEKGARLRHKAAVIRVAKIKNDTGGLDERYVVPLTFQLGGKEVDAEFNLNDRGEMVCPVLIGRNALKLLGSVDSSRTDLLKKPKVPVKIKKKPAPAKK